MADSDREDRPSPDALLAEAQRESRGRLKIFLGAAPGVGKAEQLRLPVIPVFDTKPLEVPFA